ncbi:MAG: DUF3501 family protein, partial [Alphaproteobacteria bacterium]
ATFMIEIPDADLRKRILATLGGIEETAYVEVAGERIFAQPEEDQDRTTADGKASSVQFVHFAFTDAQATAFKETGATVTLGLTHEHYNHTVTLPEAVRAELADDFD